MCRSRRCSITRVSGPISRCSLPNRLSPMLTSDGLDALDKLYREIEQPLIPVLARMERAGVALDGPALAAQSNHVDRELATRSGQIYELAGEAFNINSPQQLSKILFDKLQLPALKRNVKTQDGVDRRRGARGARPRARTAAPDPGMAGAAEAERHVHRCAAAARSTRRPAACTPASTRRSRRPGV